MSLATGVLRLHIGGEIPRDGWKILNVRPGEHVDYLGDCVNLSQFGAGTVVEIYVSHVLEHVGCLEALPGALLNSTGSSNPAGASGSSSAVTPTRTTSTRSG